MFWRNLAFKERKLTLIDLPGDLRQVFCLISLFVYFFAFSSREKRTKKAIVKLKSASRVVVVKKVMAVPSTPPPFDRPPPKGKSGKRVKKLRPDIKVA